MVDMGNSSSKTSQEIAAEAGTGPWTPKEYSSDPDYREAHMGAAKEVSESEHEFDGSEYSVSFGDIPESALQSAGDVVHQVYENDEDPRVASSGVYNDKLADEPVGDEHSSGRYEGEDAADYEGALENAEDAVKAILGEEDDPLEVSESHPMDNIGQNGVTRR